MTVFEKIWKAHCVHEVTPDTILLYIDRHYIHEVTSPQAFDGLRKAGLTVLRPQKCTATTDHNVPTKDTGKWISDSASAKQVQLLIDNCREFGIECFPIGDKNQGIVHVIGPELGRTLPGTTIVCGDSHTSTHGAFACIAFGIGTTQVEQVLATQCIIMKKPKTMRITVNNKLNPFVSPKDVILYIISKIGAEGATGHFVEYHGDVFRNMSMEGRMTVCNMSIEMGARGGLIAVDDTTIDYLKSRIQVTKEQEAHWRSFISDEDSFFDTEVSFDASDIEPMITIGTSPDTGINIGEKIGASKRLVQKALNYMQFDAKMISTEQKIDYVFIGSCTNGRIEDLRDAAEVFKGKHIANHVKAWIVPGSQQVKQQAILEGLDHIFIKAGCEFRDPGCSACLAMNNDKIPPGAVCVSTSNRNFEGRQGEGARTLLASPATAAASAICGKITSAQQLLQAYERKDI